MHAIHGERYARKVSSDGSVKLDERRYHFQQAFVGKHRALELDGPARELVVWSTQKIVKRLPIKGLRKTLLAWDEYVTQLREEAQSQWRRQQAGRQQRRAAGA